MRAGLVPRAEHKSNLLYNIKALDVLIDRYCGDFLKGINLIYDDKRWSNVPVKIEPQKNTLTTH